MDGLDELRRSVEFLKRKRAQYYGTTLIVMTSHFRDRLTLAICSSWPVTLVFSPRTDRQPARKRHRAPARLVLSSPGSRRRRGSSRTVRGVSDTRVAAVDLQDSARARRPRCGRRRRERHAPSFLRQIASVFRAVAARSHAGVGDAVLGGVGVPTHSPNSSVPLASSTICDDSATATPIRRAVSPRSGSAGR